MVSSEQIRSDAKGFMFKGEFSPSIDVLPMREHIAEMIKIVRGDEPEEENIFIARKVLTKSNQRI